MPLDMAKVLTALDAKKESYKGFDASMALHYKGFMARLGEISKISSKEIESKLSQISYPGSIPTSELDDKGLVIPFSNGFSNHRQAREWSAARLQQMQMCCVDGSQIYPSKDISLPLGLVNVAWFYNSHKGAYEKNSALDLLSPDELFLDDDPSQPSNSVVDTRRFVYECEMLKKLAISHPGSLAIFDGSLLVSFATRLPKEQRKSHVAAMLDLLRASHSSKSPVVGYIDITYARDVVKMLSLLFSLTMECRISDAGLMGNLLKKWGDRTCSFVCKREGIVDEYDKISDYGKKEKEIAFFYMRVNSGMPVRLEFPSWAVPQADEIADALRAQCAFGNGYPHMLKIVHDSACVRNEDKERFLGIFQKFQESAGLDVRISRKRISKY